MPNSTPKVVPTLNWRGGGGGGGKAALSCGGTAPAGPGGGGSGIGPPGKPPMGVVSYAPSEIVVRKCTRTFWPSDNHVLYHSSPVSRGPVGFLALMAAFLVFSLAA